MGGAAVFIVLFGHVPVRQPAAPPEGAGQRALGIILRVAVLVVPSSTRSPGPSAISSEHILGIRDGQRCASGIIHEPLQRSMNSFTFIIVGSVNLFFIWIYRVYLKMLQDRRRSN
ncbi:MAG: hypothetical protein MZU91_05325 [Desulfosudis oleivorans]|nr:hypothetical protein [Desulfosudis oleivorans]